MTEIEVHNKVLRGRKLEREMNKIIKEHTKVQARNNYLAKKYLTLKKEYDIIVELLNPKSETDNHEDNQGD